MTDISMQHLNHEPAEPAHVFRGGPPGDDLPLSSAIYGASKNYGKASQAVSEELYKAVKALESELNALRGQARTGA